MDRKYEFTWELLGDLDVGRPNLGRHTRVEVYRLMQFCMRDIIERELGAEGADRVFYEAGKLAGGFLYDEMIAGVETLDEFVTKVQDVLRELEVGVMRIEEVSPEALKYLNRLSDLLFTAARWANRKGAGDVLWSPGATR